MSALISNIIPVQGFELVRDEIGRILKVELENQKTLNPSVITEDINVYSERITPFSNSEELAINVLLTSSNYSGMTQKDTQGRTLYFIDVYTTGKEKEGLTGDLVSSSRLHRFIGLIRYILEYSEYKTLGFSPGFIGGGSVDEFNILEPSQQQDSDFTRMARITVSYKIQENQSMIQGIPLTKNSTQVKLSLTDLGHKYEFNN